MKGISLTLETVVMLILAAVVLAALLGFFLSAFTPANTEKDAVFAQSIACQKILAADPSGKCDPNKDGVAKVFNEELEKVCNAKRPTCSDAGGGSKIQNCIRSCCRAFCPV